MAVFTTALDIAQMETKGMVLLGSAEEMLNFTLGEEQQPKKVHRPSRFSEGGEALTSLALRVLMPSASLEEGIQLTDPAFFTSGTRCPDEHAFRPSSQSREAIPLLRERIAALRTPSYVG